MSAPFPDSPRHDPADTTDRLRKDIDRGVSGDKIPFPDPAAAPLGTDDEAAGTPPSREAVGIARAHETRGIDPHGPGATEEREPGEEGRANGIGGLFWLWPMAVVAASLLFVVFWTLN